MGFGTALLLLNFVLFLKLKVAVFIKQSLPSNLALGIESHCTDECCSILSGEQVVQPTCGTPRQG